MLLPMIVYKSGSGSTYPVPAWGQGGPEGTMYAANKTGWFDMKFVKWSKVVGVKNNSIIQVTGTMYSYISRYLILFVYS